MAGYKGYSMSNNAADAYNRGEMPISKWTKKAIVESILQLQEDGDITAGIDLEKVKKTSVKDLKEKVLRKTAWHHTSKNYNRTDFYEVDADLVEVYFSKRQEPEAALIGSGKADCRAYLGNGVFQHETLEGNEYRMETGETFFIANTSGKRYYRNDYKMI